MHYVGSKKRIANNIIQTIKENVKMHDDTYFVDLFCGGANLVEQVSIKNRIANDINKYSIAYLKKIQEDTSWISKDSTKFNLTKEKYKFIKDNKHLFKDYFIGYVGYNLSFNGSFFSGYKKNTDKIDYVKSAYNNAIKQSAKIQGVEFYNLDYKDVVIPKNSIIYCDIPYKNTVQYKENTEKFNYSEFFNYCRKLKKQGHTIFLSEYGDTPEYFREVARWEVQTRMLNSSKNATGSKKERWLNK